MKASRKRAKTQVNASLDSLATRDPASTKVAPVLSVVVKRPSLRPARFVPNCAH